MTTTPKTALTAMLGKAATDAGLLVIATESGLDFNQKPTTRFQLALPNDTGRKLQLELSESFNFEKPELLPAITEHLAESAKRLRNPHPDAYVTYAGLPISLDSFAWPFHRSTSGADTYVVHGTAHLANGQDSPLHAKISASMTLTFAEIVPAAEQPYAETFIYNAIRKTLDYGQLELLKSGNRQPVPVTTRYYSRWQKKFFFTDSDDAGRLEYLALKCYWLSGVLGNSAPVWIADPRDAQYLNTTVEELQRVAVELEKQGLVQVQADYASATPALMARSEQYEARLMKALEYTKPTFNEEMRAGHTNM